MFEKLDNVSEQSQEEGLDLSGLDFELQPYLSQGAEYVYGGVSDARRRELVEMIQAAEHPEKSVRTILRNWQFMEGKEKVEFTPGSMDAVGDVILEYIEMKKSKRPEAGRQDSAKAA